jgi:hydrogenase expression/formation protein HypD
MAAFQAHRQGVRNFSLLVSHVLVPPAMEAILSSPINRVQGFLAAGHVCSVMGYWEYPPIAEKYQIPIVVTGFEPLDLVQGILQTVRQLEQGTHTVENAYSRVVSKEGNRPAQEMIRRVYQVVNRNWRGIGMIPGSGWGLRSDYHSFDAEERFDISGIQVQESKICIAGEILRGMKKPMECPAFRVACSPSNPLGAPMVSSEGACSAYFRYGSDEGI